MINLREIKEERNRISEIYEITSSLQIVSSTQSSQFARQKRNMQFLYSGTVELMNYAISQDKIKMSESMDEVHIVLSCDQKFCKNFLTLLHKCLEEYQFASSDVIMLCGNKSAKFFKEVKQIDQVIQYRGINNFNECEVLSLELKKRAYPTTWIYFYSELEKDFTRVRLWPEKSETIQSNLKVELGPIDSLTHLYVSIKLYWCALQTALKERLDRAMAMSEASDNAQAKFSQLKNIYNKERQSSITKEIISGG